MKKPMIRKKCPTCGAAFSGRVLARVNALLAGHDCRAEQQKRERAVAGERMAQSMIQGAMLGMLSRMLSSGLPFLKGALLPPPMPGGKRTKNPLRSARVKSTPRPVEKGRRKPPSQ